MRQAERFIAIALAAAISTAAVAQDVALRFAGIEVHGDTSATTEAWIQSLDLPPAGHPVDRDGLDAICAKLRRPLDDGRFLYLGCATVARPEGEVHVVLDVVAPDDAERLAHPALLPVDHLRLAERGGERRSEELIACVRGCGQAADRADALDFLDRLDWGKASCKAALDALDDRDRFVRHQAALRMQHHFSRCSDTLGATRIVDASLRLLTRPTHLDRSHALDLLNHLALSGADIDPARRTRMLAAAETLAVRSRLPEVGGNAAALADRIRSATDAGPIAPE